MNILQTLTNTKQQTIPFFDLPEQDLQKSYGTGKWNIRQILVHLADAEGILHERIKRIIAEPRQVIWAFDQDRWCSQLDYQHFPVNISKSLYLAHRESIIYLAEKYYETLGAKEFVHSETGVRTLQQEFDKVASHNQGHITQILSALT
jgi:hypothetical protein